MTITDIVALAKAGFTAEQIAQLSIAPAPAPVDNSAALLSKMDQFMQMFQNSNIMGSNQPKPLTVDDVIASIINPKPENKED